MNTLVYLGTPDMSADLLERILTLPDIKVIGVVTQPAKPLGKKKVLTPSPVYKVAEKHNIPVATPIKLNKDYSFIESLKPDLLLTFAFGQILSSKVLACSKYQALNLHGSILPKYRGAAPMQYALMNGEKRTGVTLQAMVKEMDGGDIYGTKEFDIDEEDNCSSLATKMVDAAFSLLEEKIYDFFADKIVPVQQDLSKVTFAPSIKPEMEHLDPKMDAHSFVNMVRALSLNPGAYLYINDTEKLKILKANVYSDRVLAPLGAITLQKKDLLILQVKDGEVALKTVQRSGKKVMDAASFNNGNHLEGVILK